jgi:glycosyltransferase involved in cell wall biosynthesis
MIFFSIIIPTFNRGELLLTCIDSLKNQTFTNFECIIIDDGSTDNTKDLVIPIINEDERFTYYYQSNSERSVSRNNGIKKAKGEYIICLDSDDFFKPEHLEIIHQKISFFQKPVGMFFCNATILEKNEEHHLDINIPEGVFQSIPIDFFLKNSVVPARVCIHHSIFNTFQFDVNSIVVEDTVLWTEIMSLFPIYYLDTCTVVYHLHEDNSVNIRKNNAYNQRLKGLKVLFNQKPVGKSIPSSIKKIHLNRCYRGIAEYHFYQERYSHQFMWIWYSVFLFPNIDSKEKIKMLFKAAMLTVKQIISRIFWYPYSDKQKIENYQTEIRNIEWSILKGYIHKKSKFLDVGCGSGHNMLKAELELSCDVYGIDPAPGSHGVGRFSELTDHHLKIMQGTAEKIPFQNQEFDVIFCSHVLEHVESEEKSLVEINRVLKDEGVLIIGMPTSTLALIALISHYLFTTHVNILFCIKSIGKKEFIQRFIHIFIPRSHSFPNANYIGFDLIMYNKRRWKKKIEKKFNIQTIEMPCMYPFPDYIQWFPKFTSKFISGSVFFICTKK